MKKVYQLTKEELFQDYGNEKGLSSEMAMKNLQKYKENVLEEKGKRSIDSGAYPSETSGKKRI